MSAKQPPVRIVLLDTHAILHRAYHALPDFASGKGEPTGALYGLVSMLVKIITDLKPDHIIAAFDLPEPTHRHIAYAEYKAQRKKADDALVAQLIRSRDVLDAFGIPRYECSGFEADDVIGTIVESLKGDESADIIIASGDKDLLQLIDGTRVRVYTFKQTLADTVLYDAASMAEKYGFTPAQVTDYKGIVGDPSDNITGVPGVGEGSAVKLLATYGSIESLLSALQQDGVEVVAKAAAIQKRYAQMIADHEEDALFSKELSTIRRDAPIHFALPEQSWRERVETSKVFDMLAEFDFRGLVPRVKALLANGAPEAEASAQPSIGFDEGEVIAPEELGPVALAVWVLDSSITQPGLDDIYRTGKSRVFAEAKQNILHDIAERNLDFVYEQIELPLTPVLRQIENTGVKIDTAFLRELSTTYHTQLADIAARIYEAAGGPFNINSPKQLGDVLFDRLGLAVKNQKKTAGGQRSTKESELEKMRSLHPIITDILAHRELSKLLGTYIDTIPTMLDEQSRLHTTYVQAGTTTGRLSSQNPNLQNIPIKTDLGRAIRNAFVASPGMQLVAFDYSQLELRIAAFLSEDEALLDIFKADRDVHTEVASRVFHVRAEDVSYEQRRRAKVINFGILYGMGVNSLRESLGSTRAEAQEFFEQYFAAFPRLAEYLEGTKADASRLGYTETYFGRRRYFEGIQSKIPYIKASAERMAINAPIQGTEADMIKLAMVQIAAWIKNEGIHDDIHLLLQVHDELVFEVREGKVESCAARIRAIMENVIPEKDRKGIPFKAEGEVGANWGDMQELQL